MGQLDLLIRLAESEYGGGSFNGPNLVKTLRSMSLEQATTTATYEGYSVWSIVLHLMYWKHEVAGLLGDSKLSDFAYESQNWPAVPELQTEASWQQTLEYLDAVNAAYIAAVRAFPEVRLTENMDWGCTYGEALAWMATHDTYHTAQIRNMGISDLAIGRPPA